MRLTMAGLALLGQVTAILYLSTAIEVISFTATAISDVQMEYGLTLYQHAST